MIHSFLVSGLYVAGTLAAISDNSQEASPTVKVASLANAVVAAPSAAQTGPFGLSSLSDLFRGNRGSGSSDGLFSGFLSGLSGGGSTSAPPTNKKVWQPKVGAPFQIILSSAIVLHPNPVLSKGHSTAVSNNNTEPPKLFPERVDIFDVDLWDNPTETIERLHARGKKVICYFSAGTSEDWRPDFKDFKSDDMGAKLPLWKGERWLDIRQRSVWGIIQKRIELASKRGCDAIDPDNVDGFDNENGGGFKRPLTKQDSVAFIRKISREAKRYGMSTGLKNAAAILRSVEADVHFAVNEECAEMRECDVYSKFLSSKPVFHIEYVRKKAKAAKTGSVGGAKTAGVNVGGVTTVKGSSAPPSNLQESKPIKARGILEEGSEGNGIADLFEITNPKWPTASTPSIRKSLCLGTPPTGVGSRMSTVIKEMSLSGWVMYCDGGTSETRTILPDGQMPQKGKSETGKAGFNPAKGIGSAWGRQRLNATVLEAGPKGEAEESQEGAEATDEYDSDLQAIIINNPGTSLTDDVWNSDIGPISVNDLAPNSEVKHRGAGKDRRGPDGFVDWNEASSKRAVAWVS